MSDPQAAPPVPPMAQTPEDARDRILGAARRRVAADPSASLAAVAAEAGVSRATVYRYFASRAALLDAIDVEPDPDASERILAAALDLIGMEGLRGMSMEELAVAAGVSRASVYRLFPGKPALFAALLAAYSPFGPLGEALARVHDRPPEEVLPELLRTAARVVGGRVPIVRSLLLEVAAGTPEAVEAAQAAIRPLYAGVSAYLAAQVAAGRMRPIEPVIAAQAVMGPLVFHLISQPFLGPVAGVEIDPVDAADIFAQTVIHGLLP
jgi:AcrR family transcriptional regulator